MYILKKAGLDTGSSETTYILHLGKRNGGNNNTNKSNALEFFRPYCIPVFYGRGRNRRLELLRKPPPRNRLSYAAAEMKLAVELQALDSNGRRAA